MSTIIFTDAASNLYPAILKEKELPIHVTPMTLDIGKKEYHCYSEDIDVEALSKDFYKEMREGGRPRTSLPSPGLLEEALRKELEKGNDVLIVTLSSNISGTNQSASLLASELNEEAKKERVKVLDSKTAGLGEGMIALYAAKLAKEGLSLNEIYEKSLSYVERVRSEFTVDSIKYLAATGRVSNFAAVLASVLMIKPLLYGSPEGKIEVTSKVTGRKNSLKRLAEQCNENILDKKSLVYIAHCDAPEDAEYLRSLLAAYGIENTETHYYDLVTGAHVGPGTIAIFYEGTKRSFEKKSILKSILGKKGEEE